MQLREEQTKAEKRVVASEQLQRSAFLAQASSSAAFHIANPTHFHQENASEVESACASFRGSCTTNKRRCAKCCIWLDEVDISNIPVS